MSLSLSHSLSSTHTQRACIPIHRHDAVDDDVWHHTAAAAVAAAAAAAAAGCAYIHTHAPRKSALFNDSTIAYRFVMRTIRSLAGFPFLINRANAAWDSEIFYAHEAAALLISPRDICASM